MSSQQPTVQSGLSGLPTVQTDLQLSQPQFENGSVYRSNRPTTVYGRYHYLRNVDGQPVKAHRTSDSCIVTVGATKRTSREPSVLWEPHGWPLVLFCSRVSGSPSRAWGRPDALLSRVRQCRFTPTCVGTAWTFRARLARRSVHPHVRGDGPVEHSSTAIPVGSPPRAWGRLFPARDFLPLLRFTPTCVGTAKKPKV